MYDNFLLIFSLRVVQRTSFTLICSWVFENEKITLLYEELKNLFELSLRPDCSLSEDTKVCEQKARIQNFHFREIGKI